MTDKAYDKEKDRQSLRQRERPRPGWLLRVKGTAANKQHEDTDEDKYYIKGKDKNKDKYKAKNMT
jgi:hypothetical protein